MLTENDIAELVKSLERSSWSVEYHVCGSIVDPFNSRWGLKRKMFGSESYEILCGEVIYTTDVNFVRCEAVRGSAR